MLFEPAEDFTMIEYGTGSIFDVDVECIVNPVNTCGIMGSGLAKAFKDRFPLNNKLYETDCFDGSLRIGVVTFHQDAQLNGFRLIANFPTKDKYWNDSELSYIESGMEYLVKEIVKRKIQSIAIPALGCGLGKLKWADVELIIRKHLEQIPDIKVTLFPPQ